MIENYIANLSICEKQSVKEWVTAGFPEPELDLNAMGFIHDEQRGIVVVVGLIVGDAIDGLEYMVPDFQALVKEVLADVPIYHTEAEKVAALHTYLSALPLPQKKYLKRRLPRLTTKGDLTLKTMDFLYDEELVRVVVNIGKTYHWTDQFSLMLVDFLLVVREVVADAELAG